MADEPVPFESNIARLREVVGRLERGDEGQPLPLEDSLALFEEGVGLAKAAAGALEAAEARVDVLLADGSVEPLNDGRDDEEP